MAKPKVKAQGKFKVGQVVYNNLNAQYEVIAEVRTEITYDTDQFSDVRSDDLRKLSKAECGTKAGTKTKSIWR